MQLGGPSTKPPPEDSPGPSSSASLAPDGSAVTSPVPLTKNAQKRLIKEARRQEHKLERRAKEKLLKKVKKKVQAEKRAAGESLGDLESPKKKPRLGKPRPFHARVVIDLGFDEKMRPKEVNSLCSQLNYTYSANRKASSPFSSLMFTSLNGMTKETLERVGDKAYLRWRGVEWWEESYEKLWESEKPPEDLKAFSGDAVAQETISDIAKDHMPEGHPMLSNSESSPRSTCPKENVVYLSADSENEILELVEGETYVIGGIVDHNRYKNLCQNKAVAQGIRTARLPIGKYMAQLQTRKVLTVNQVFDILLRWVEDRDWEKALIEVVPRRKFKDGPKSGPSSQGGDVNEDGDDVGADEKLEGRDTI